MAKGRKTGGRKAGTPNKTTNELKVLALQYTAEAVERLAAWMRSDNPKASVAACGILLDRGHGKAAQILDATVNGVLGYTAIPTEQRASDALASAAGPATAGDSERPH